MLYVCMYIYIYILWQCFLVDPPFSLLILPSQGCGHLFGEKVGASLMDFENGNPWDFS